MFDVPWLVEPVRGVYPGEAILRGQSGTVTGALDVLSDGTVSSYEVTGSGYPLLAEAAVSAVDPFRMDVDAPGAESIPHRKLFRVRFELDGL